MSKGQWGHRKEVDRIERLVDLRRKHLPAAISHLHGMLGENCKTGCGDVGKSDSFRCIHNMLEINEMTMSRASLCRCTGWIRRQSLHFTNMPLIAWQGP